MKNLMFLACLPILVGVSCEESDLQECIKGTVIGYQSCYNVNIIQIQSGSLKGNSIIWEGENYDNIVQFPGGRITDNLIYFDYRIFDPDKDEDYGWDICTANIIPLNVPTIVITNYSTSNCP